MATTKRKKSTTKKPKLRLKSRPKPKHQPLSMGTMIWCLVTGLSMHHPYIGRGKIRFYNPATEGSAFVTKGRPFYGVDIDGYYELVPIDKTRTIEEGPDDLYEMMAVMYDESADGHEKSASAMRAKAAEIRAMKK